MARMAPELAEIYSVLMSNIHWEGACDAPAWKFGVLVPRKPHGNVHLAEDARGGHSGGR